MVVGNLPSVIIPPLSTAQLQCCLATCHEDCGAKDNNAGDRQSQYHMQTTIAAAPFPRRRTVCKASMRPPCCARCGSTVSAQAQNLPVESEFSNSSSAGAHLDMFGVDTTVGTVLHKLCHGHFPSTPAADCPRLVSICSWVCTFQRVLPPATLTSCSSNAVAFGK